MNLYSKKQRWKIGLLSIALILIALSLYFSNTIVQKVSIRERYRVTQWAEAIKKKAELVQLTNQTFTQLRDLEKDKMELWALAIKQILKPIDGNNMPDYELPFKIIGNNVNIPVILYDNQSKEVSEFKNLGFDYNDFKKQHIHQKDSVLRILFNKRLIHIANSWKNQISIEIDKNWTIICAYTDSKEITKLENNRDSLIKAFNKELKTNKGAVPVLLVNAENKEMIASNIPGISTQKISEHINRLKKNNNPIPIIFSSKQNSLLYYDDSPELKQLQFFPYIQFIIFTLFIFVGYLILNTFRKAEQNQVWAGMAKETAHQLGTPLSSLLAWVQYLESIDLDPSIASEMQKDVARLEQVANRFSKIGSSTQLENKDINQTVSTVFNYLKTRVSSKIGFEFSSTSSEILVPHNPALIEWVIENICKNAVDSMETEGQLKIDIHTTENEVHIDIQDTGKGIPHNQFKTIFKPGFTTKKRGWGLGLSLVKRIIKEYHKGNVFVLHSEPDKGTTFRITLRK
ncbi:MAG: sensor histidine kinase [Crocinitomicaceae bacterium]|jgi:hypothetical protein